MTADCLMMQGARASATMILTCFPGLFLSQHQQRWWLVISLMSVFFDCWNLMPWSIFIDSWFYVVQLLVHVFSSSVFPSFLLQHMFIFLISGLCSWSGWCPVTPPSCSDLEKCTTRRETNLRRSSTTMMWVIPGKVNSLAPGRCGCVIELP